MSSLIPDYNSASAPRRGGAFPILRIPLPSPPPMGEALGWKRDQPAEAGSTSSTPMSFTFVPVGPVRMRSPRASKKA